MVARTVQLITGVKLVTRQIPVPHVLKAKKWELDWENKKVIVHQVSITLALTRAAVSRLTREHLVRCP